MTSETPPPAPTLLLRNLIASLLLSTFKSLLFYAHKYQLLDTFRAAFLFFLRFLPSSFLDCAVSVSGEKQAAESLWLARKLVACDCGEEAVRMWANASNLGWLALSAHPRLQPSLLKLAAFLLKEAKEMGLDETEGSKTEPRMQLKLKMLLSWVPLLCRASNGTDAPVLSTNERIELERVLEEIIEGMEQEEEKERVLSLWLHHFTHCPSSDWPNLHACYARWCTASRKQLLLQ